ncbi:MAG: DNA repair protein RecO [Candidatus Omnitrophica bacterium]|nr:DNA repair protein RecO [Candidatus Omnitrophota bacterium]MDD5554005.1 DNA repair protein RecO [Candidatus Omnitrophota bacterium]
MSIHKTEVLVLRKWDFRETSLVVNFFSRDFGKLSGILKGIRQEPAKFASTLEPFSRNEIVFYKKTNTSLHLVSQCDVRDNFSPIRENISKVGAASFMMELIDALTAQEDPNAGIFDFAATALKEMAVNDNPDKIMTIFKIKMLSFTGFKPHFDSCVSCGERVNGHSKFSFTLGGLLCLKCYPKDHAARSIFRGTVASILHIEKNDFRSNLNLGMNPQIKRELNTILNAFLNFHLEKELKSQKVLNKMENFSRSYKGN